MTFINHSMEYDKVETITKQCIRPYISVALLIAALVCMSFAQAATNETGKIDDKQNTADTLDPAQGGALDFSADFKQFLKDVTTLEKWSEVSGDASEPGVEGQIRADIEKIIRRMKTNSEEYKSKYTMVEGREWLKDFLPTLIKTLSDYVSKHNQMWRNDYLALVQDFNSAQAELQRIKEIINNFEFSLNTIRDNKIRIKAVRDVFKQNLQGVPTTFVIIGRREWDVINESQHISYTRINKSAPAYILENVSNNNLIFSDTEVQSANVTKEIIKRYKGGLIEPYETDPVVFQKNKWSHVVQLYRCYPRFSVNNVGEKQEPTERNSASVGGVEYAQVTYDNIAKISEQWGLGPKIREKITKLLQQAQRNNQSSTASILTFDENYNDEMEAIQRIMSETKTSINTYMNSLANNVSKNFPDVDLVALQKEVKHFVGMSEAEYRKEERIRNTISQNLSEIKALYEKLRNQAEEKFKDKIRKRKMMILTLNQEFIHKDQHVDDLTKDLLDGALHTLSARKKKLINFELTVIVDGKLKNLLANEYYKTGQVRKYFIVPPILTHVPEVEGETTRSRLSLFLAQEVEFIEDNLAGGSVEQSREDRDQTKQRPADYEKTVQRQPDHEKTVQKQPDHKKTVQRQEDRGQTKSLDIDEIKPSPEPDNKSEPKPNLQPVGLTGSTYVDKSLGLEWYMYAEKQAIKCVTIEAGESKLPQGFKIPTFSQLVQLRNNLKKNEGAAEKTLFMELLASDRMVWSQDRHRYLKKYKTLHFKTNEDKFTAYDACDVLVGVKAR